MSDRVFLLTCLLLVAVAGHASAMELDTLLPTDVPGYGVAPAVGVLDRTQPDYTPVEIDLGNVALVPKIGADAGYDSDPNGVAAGSSQFDFDPSLLALDADFGLGGYAAGTFTDFPQAAGQNLTGYTLGLGEHAVLPRETVVLGLAAVSTEETGFGLNTVSLAKPIGVLVRDARASDAIICGMATLTPQFSVTGYRFSGYGGQDRTDYRQSLTTDFAPGGPARFVTLLHATQSVYREGRFNATTYSALAGIADAATQVWNLRLLAGAATRRPALGDPVSAPVLEASIGWMPGDLDSVQLNAAREIDDPDQESAEGYTLSEMDVSISHEYLRNVVFTASFKFSHAAYLDTSLVESLYNGNAGLVWRLNRALQVNAAYAFTDRKANYLRAANQHIFTLGVTWSP